MCFHTIELNKNYTNLGILGLPETANGEHLELRSFFPCNHSDDIIHKWQNMVKHLSFIPQGGMFYV